ncbi:MAG: helix-turn-helix domain-containing protein, partial [Nocardioides sp.]
MSHAGPHGNVRGLRHHQAHDGVRGLVVRLDPNNNQASYLAGCAGAYRKAYDYAVEQLRANTEDYRYLRDAGAPNDALPRPL